MISTVTTTTMAIVATLGLSAALGSAAVLALILFLTEHELATAAGARLRPLARNLTVVIVPLLIVFVVIVVKRLAAPL